MVGIGMGNGETREEAIEVIESHLSHRSAIEREADFLEQYGRVRARGQAPRTEARSLREDIAAVSKAPYTNTQTLLRDSTREFEYVEGVVKAVGGDVVEHAWLESGDKIYEITLDDRLVVNADLVYYGTVIPARTVRIQISDVGTGVGVVWDERGVNLDTVESSVIGRL